MKLALCLDKSEAYLEFMKDAQAKEWDPRKPIKKVDSISSIGGSPLFGGGSMSWFPLKTKEDVASLMDYFSSTDSSKISKRFENGVVLTSSIHRNSTRKLEKAVEELGGRLVLETDRDKRAVTNRVLSAFPLSDHVRDFAVDYIADDYDLSLPLSSYLSNLSSEEIERLTEDDVFQSLPSAPGSIPPWDVENALLDGNLSLAIELSRRVGSRGSSNPILLLGYLRKKFTQYFEVASSLPSSDDDLSQFFGIKKGYSLTFTKKTAKSLGKRRSYSCLEILSRYDSFLKGHSFVNSSILMDMMLLELGLAISKD